MSRHHRRFLKGKQRPAKNSSSLNEERNDETLRDTRKHLILEARSNQTNKINETLHYYAGYSRNNGLLTVYLDIKLEDFQKLQHSSDPAERQKYETFRKHAKAFNFGIAGGEGVHGIQSHALAAYGVNLSIQEAKKFKHLLTTTVRSRIISFY
jgi:hypothetical protein